MGLCYNYKQASRGEKPPGLGSGWNVFCGIFITKVGGGRGHNTPFSKGQAFFSRVVKIFCQGQTPPGDREYNLNVSRSSPKKGGHGVEILPRFATDWNFQPLVQGSGLTYKPASQVKVSENIGFFYRG